MATEEPGDLSVSVSVSVSASASASVSVSDFCYFWLMCYHVTVLQCYSAVSLNHFQINPPLLFTRVLTVEASHSSSLSLKVSNSLHS